MDRLNEIRESERNAHIDDYTKHALYQEGSWLRKPVKTVLDILPCYASYDSFRVLDLGCGVGRNAVAVAKKFRRIPCRIDCVDILELAIEMLNRNAEEYGVAESIHGEVMPLEDYPVSGNIYDLILAVSALEHVNSEESFTRMLFKIHDGIREFGIVCLIINAEVTERDKGTGKPMPAQFEVNLSCEVLVKRLTEVFDGWYILKHGIQEQRYDITRGNRVHDLHSHVVTFVARKPGRDS